MLEGTSLVSNKVETLRNTAGETIHDVIMVKERTDGRTHWNKLIVFKTGYSLEITDRGSFWVNNRVDTKKIIQKELDRRKRLAEVVEEAEYAIEIFGSIDI